MKDDNIKYWFSLENGVHVPVREGESKREAAQKVIGKMSRVERNKDKYNKIDNFKRKKQSNNKIEENEQDQKRLRSLAKEYQIANDDEKEKIKKEQEEIYSKYHKERNYKLEKVADNKYIVKRDNLQSNNKVESEYELYKRAKNNPDSIDPMTENSTDWKTLEKKYSQKYINELDKEINNLDNAYRRGQTYNLYQLDRELLLEKKNKASDTIKAFKEKKKSNNKVETAKKSYDYSKYSNEKLKKEYEVLRTFKDKKMQEETKALKQEMDKRNMYKYKVVDKNGNATIALGSYTKREMEDEMPKIIEQFGKIGYDYKNFIITKYKQKKGK